MGSKTLRIALLGFAVAMLTATVASSKPIAGVEVFVTIEDGANPSLIARATTNARGRFSLQVRTNGKFSFDVECPSERCPRNARVVIVTSGHPISRSLPYHTHLTIRNAPVTVSGNAFVEDEYFEGDGETPAGD